MSNYILATDYYPDDKDIYDFLDSQKVSTNQMLKYLGKRGIFGCDSADNESLKRYFSLLNVDWFSAVDLVNMIGRRESAGKLIHIKVETVTTTRQIRSELEGFVRMPDDYCEERLRVEEKEDTVILSGTFVEVNTSKSRILQKHEKFFEIRIRPTDTTVYIAYTNTWRAESIVEDLFCVRRNWTNARHRLV